MDLRIAAFITVSTLAHGGAVLWFDATNPMPQLALGGEARALRVALEARSLQVSPAYAETHPPQTVKPDPGATEHSRPTTEHNTHKRQHTVSRSHPQLAKTDTAIVKKAALETAVNNRPPASNNNTTTPPRSSAENASKHISAALKNQLARHFEYPWLARQRGWQGQVLLSLHVASNGDLSNWKVVRTSGYRTLDQSALKAARRIEHLPQAERWLNGESLEVRLPVQYKLLDS